MVFVITDNNSERLRKLSNLVCKTYPGSVIYEFVDPMLSAKYICNNHVDVVLAEEKMKPVDGEALQKVLNIHQPDLPVILLPEYNEKVMPDEETEWMDRQVCDTLFTIIKRKGVFA